MIEFIEIQWQVVGYWMAWTVEEFIAKVFSMPDAAWERHANPLSVWTGYSILPILVIEKQDYKEEPVYRRLKQSC